MYYTFIFLNLSWWFNVYKKEYGVVFKIDNNREESYIILEELVLHFLISLSYLIILFDFTTNNINIFYFREIKING